MHSRTLLLALFLALPYSSLAKADDGWGPGVQQRDDGDSKANAKVQAAINQLHAASTDLDKALRVLSEETVAKSAKSLRRDLNQTVSDLSVKFDDLQGVANGQAKATGQKFKTGVANILEGIGETLQKAANDVRGDKPTGG